MCLDAVGPVRRRQEAADVEAGLALPRVGEVLGPEQRRDVPVAGDVVLDPLEQRVWVAGVEVILARREFAMLNALMVNAGRVVSRSRLFDEVWEGEVDLRSNSIDVHISRLRGRLEGSASVKVVTLRGVGYRLETAG